MATFRKRSESTSRPESAEAVFRALRPTDGSVRHLWAHQADLLRDYHQLDSSATNVAIELPTGGGKTLVNLLICEFRRQALDQRVAYLCPTIQLARQAVEKATAYGVPAVDLTGPQAEYPPNDFLAYTRSNAIGVSTYNGVFNSNPKIDAAQTILLDDAHAGEAPVANLWSVDAKRDDGELFDALLGSLTDALPEAFAERMNDIGLDPWKRNQVELVPPDETRARADLMRDALAVHATNHNAYAAEMLADHLDNCLVYVSWNSILIRPLLPPTINHFPFSGAEQRIYASATLGSGGELERSFGVLSIARLQVPAGWDDHGAGRRFFVFPDVSLTTPEADALTKAAIERSKRALVIAPSRTEIGQIAGRCVPDDAPRVTATDMEDGSAAFLAEEKAVLLLPNRYDGIDLPDESCRLIVMSGLPSAMHLQERFLFDRLRAQRVLAERVRTRIVQGSGRCTRNPQDFSAVIIRGEALTDFCARDENVRSIHGELQAEIEFGLDNCEDPDQDLGALLAHFFAQDEEWIQGDADIRARANETERQPPADSGALADAALKEVEAWRAVWSGELDRAVGLAQEVTDRLSGGEELRPYRALWFVLGASWAKASGAEDELVATLRHEAAGCARRLPWNPIFDDDLVGDDVEDAFDLRGDRASIWMRDAGIRGSRFERRLSEIDAQLQTDDSDQFELGLKALGDLLGFESIRPDLQASPDGVWRDGNTAWIVWEAKTEEVAENPINAKEIRQAKSHVEWISSEYEWPDPESAATAIVSHKTTIHPDAAKISAGISGMSPDDVRSVADRAFQVQRAVRSRARGMTDGKIATALTEEFKKAKLDTPSVLGFVESSAVAELSEP